MRVVCLPRGEEHGKHRNQRGEGANLCASIAHSRRFEERCQSAVQRVYTMAKVAISIVICWRIWAHDVLLSRTQKVRLGGSMCRFGALAFRRRCPWWSTWTGFR
jgi:hypothetical protein